MRWRKFVKLYIMTELNLFAATVRVVTILVLNVPGLKFVYGNFKGKKCVLIVFTV